MDRHKTDPQKHQLQQRQPFFGRNEHSQQAQLEAFATISKFSSQMATEQMQKSINQKRRNMENYIPETRNNMSPLNNLQEIQTDIHDNRRFHNDNREVVRNRNAVFHLQSEKIQQRNHSLKLQQQNFKDENLQTRTQLKRMQEKMEYLERNTRQQLSHQTHIHRGLRPVHKNLDESLWAISNQNGEVISNLSQNQKYSDQIPSPKVKLQPQHFDLQKSISQSYDTKLAMSAAASKEKGMFELSKSNINPEQYDRGNIFGKNRSTLDHNSTKPIMQDHTTAFETPTGPSQINTFSLQTDEMIMKASIDFQEKHDSKQKPRFLVAEDYLIPKLVKHEASEDQISTKNKVDDIREQLQLLKHYQKHFEKASRPDQKLVYDKITATANFQKIKMPPKNKKNFFVSDQSDYQNVRQPNSRMSKKPKKLKQAKIYNEKQELFKNLETGESIASQRAFAYMDKKLQQFDRVKAEMQSPESGLFIIKNERKLNQSESNRNLRIKQEVKVQDRLRSERVSSLDLNQLTNENGQNLSFGMKDPYSIDHLYQNQNNDYSYNFQEDMRSHNQSVESQVVDNIQTDPELEDFRYENKILTKEQKRYLNKQQKQMVQIAKISSQKKSGHYLNLFEQQRQNQMDLNSNDSFFQNQDSRNHFQQSNPFTNDYRGNPIPLNLGLQHSNSNELFNPLNNSKLSGYEVSPNREFSQYRKQTQFKQIKTRKPNDMGTTQQKSPYDGIFEMKVKKLQHKKEFQVDKMPIIIHQPKDSNKNFMLSGHSPTLNDRETLIESKLKQIKEQQSYVRQMKGIDRFKVEKIVSIQNEQTKQQIEKYNTKDYQITNEQVEQQKGILKIQQKINKSKENNKYQQQKVMQFIQQKHKQSENKQWLDGREEESTHYTSIKTPNKNQQVRPKNQIKKASSPTEVSSRASPSLHKLESINELTQSKQQEEYQQDLLKNLIENKTVKNKKSSYIQSCLKNNQHYTEQKLKSLNWLKKDSSHDTLTKVITNKNLEEHQKKLRLKQEIQAKYNQMSKDNFLMPGMEDGCYKFVLVKGNNSSLVKRVLDVRENWSLLTESSSLYSFKWAPISKFINFEQLSIHGQRKMCNHFERHEVLTTKDLLFQNMQRFCEQQKQDVFQYLPIQFVVDFSQKNHTQEIDKFCQYFNCIESVVKRDKEQESSQIQGDNLQQINTLLQANKNFNTETPLMKNKMFRKFNLLNEMFDDGNVWLIKPNDFNRGRGVKLFNKLSSLVLIIKELTQTTMDKDLYSLVSNTCSIITNNERQFQNAALKKTTKQVLDQSDQKITNPATSENNVNLSANVKSEVFVIQKYLERPLLIDSRKFDIRLWVLITHDLKCYLFKEGYIRTSSYQFTLSQESIDQPFIHLTNNAVQQFDENYGKLEEGNQMSFKQAQQILQQQGQDVDFYQILNDEICPIIEMTLKSAESKINPNNRKFCMEILGYDFMIDENCKPWLIEVNTNPCLEETSQLLNQYLPRMLDDAFKLTIDVVFPRQNKSAANNLTGEEQEQGQRQVGEGQHSQFKVEGHSDQENLWRQIYAMR